MSLTMDNIIDKLYRVALSKVYRLEVKEDLKGGFISYGKKNDYPEYLLGLAENQAEHGAILKTKSEYITGQGIESDDPRITQWLKTSNPNEDWNTVIGRNDIDKTIFGAYALKIVPNPLGTPLYHFQIDYGKIRMSTCLKFAIYCDDWSDKKATQMVYPVWYKGCTDVAIYIHKDYFPTTKKIKGAYGHPEYSQVITDIDTDVRVGTFFNVLVQNNFNPGALITIFKNNATKEDRTYVSENLKNEHTGEETAGNLLINFADPVTGKGADVQQLNGNELDKQYQEVCKRNQDKIVIAHRINPILAGIQQDGKLGLTQELQQSHELFINGYAIPNQKAKIKTLETFSTLELGFDTKGLFKIKQLKLINQALPLDNPAVITAIGPVAFADYIYKNFDVEKPEPLPGTVNTANGQPLPVEQSAANDHIKDMSLSQKNRVLAIVKDFNNKKITEPMAMILLKGHGLTDADAKAFLATTPPVSAPPVKMNSDKSKLFLSLLHKYAHDVNENDEVLETHYITGDEVKMSSVQFSGGTLSKNQLRNGILSQIKTNPSITNEKIAETFGIEVSEVKEATDWLVSKGLLSNNKTGFDFTDKALNKDDGTITEVYTEYNYGLRDGVPGPVILDTTRQDCKDWYDLYGKGKKAIALEAIDKMKNEFGENAFDYSGGFWHNPETGETEVRCRHGWKGSTKSRQVKK